MSVTSVHNIKHCSVTLVTTAETKTIKIGIECLNSYLKLTTLIDPDMLPLLENNFDEILETLKGPFEVINPPIDNNYKIVWKFREEYIELLMKSSTQPMDYVVPKAVNRVSRLETVSAESSGIIRSISTELNTQKAESSLLKEELTAAKAKIAKLEETISVMELAISTIQDTLNPPSSYARAARRSIDDSSKRRKFSKSRNADEDMGQK